MFRAPELEESPLSMLMLLISLISTLLVLQPHKANAFQPQLLSSASPRHYSPLPLARSYNQSDATSSTPKEAEESDSDEELDTIRVRIWRQLADGKELSLSQLSNAVGERRLGELRSHLTHVEKQAKTIRNKSDDWRTRRGLAPVAGAPRKMKLKFRKGKKNETFIRIV